MCWICKAQINSENLQNAQMCNHRQCEGKYCISLDTKVHNFSLKSIWNGNLCLNYIHTLCSSHTLSSIFLKLENTKGLLLWFKGAALEPVGLGCFLIIPKYLLCIMICIAHKNWKELWVRSVCPNSQFICWSVRP